LGCAIKWRRVYLLWFFRYAYARGDQHRGKIVGLRTEHARRRNAVEGLRRATMPFNPKKPIHLTALKKFTFDVASNCDHQVRMLYHRSAEVRGAR
jgi:hypothetical protein